MTEQTATPRAEPGVWRRMVDGGVYYLLPNLMFLGFAFMPYVTGSIDVSALPWTLMSLVLIAVTYTLVSLARWWALAWRICWLAVVLASLLTFWPFFGIETVNFIVFLTISTALLLPVRAAVPLIVAETVLAGTGAAITGSITALLLSIFGLIGGIALALGMVIFERNERLRAVERRVATLAVAAERERIGRDLHDILGHSLTAVTVKAQLAGRLVDVDPDRARAEMAEVESITRQALADVRATSSGMQSVRVAAEVASARSVLAASGVQSRTPSAMPELDDDRSELFGYVVREAVTNVVRHAGATTCTIEVDAGSASVTDDGSGGANAAKGTGLAGLTARASEAGMRLTVRSGERGTTVRVEAA